MWYARTWNLIMVLFINERLSMARKPHGEKPPDPVHDPFPEKLRRLVEAKRASRTDREIAQAAGISRQAFSEFLTGRNTNPKLQTLLRILKALDATLTDYDRA